MKNKAFTLIELLAVIIILGILMLIAIPSVTQYINNSRKESYVNSIKELIKGTSSLANSGELSMLDTDTTYYVPVGAIDLENGNPRSPYGELTDAYVVVTFDGEDYDYYYVGKDEADMGVSKITSDEKLTNKSIRGDVGDTDLNVGLKGKSNIVVFDENRNPGEPRPAIIKTDGKGEREKGPCPSSYTETIYWALQDNNGDGLNEKLVIADHEVNGALHGSFAGTTSRSFYNVPWIMTNGSSRTDNLSYNVNEIVIEGNVVPKSTSGWFYDIGFASTSITADLSGLEVCKVTNMSNMFSFTGQNATTLDIGDITDWDTSNVIYMNGMFNAMGRQNKNWYVGNLSDWNTSNVKMMQYMFCTAGDMSDTWFVGDLGDWDTSNVTDMSYMFEDTGVKSSNWSIGDISNWDTSNVTDMTAMFWAAGLSTTNWNIGDIGKWDISKVTSMRYMFTRSADNVYDWNIGNIGNWDVSNVTDMYSMFSTIGLYKHIRTFTLDISKWNMSKVTNMTYMFSRTATDAEWNVIIPKTNGNGINNDANKLYGANSGVYDSPPSGKTFTVAS